MSLKEQLNHLLELQELDLKLDIIENEKRSITNRLELNKEFLGKLITDLEVQKEKLGEIKEAETSKKETLKELTGALKLRQKRLTMVSSPKEYSALEKEIDSQKKALDRLREEVVFLVEEITSTEDSIATKEEKIVQLRESIALEVDGSQGEISKFDQEIQRLKQQETDIRAAVSRPNIYKYDFIRARRRGEAVIGAKDGHCEGCFMALPPQGFIEIQRGEKLITCPSCQRILYYVPSDDENENDDEDE